MRIAAALTVCLGLLALSWATASFAEPAVTASPELPSPVINVGSGASADVRLSASGVGLIEQFTDETGKNIGPYAADYPTFHIPAFGGGLAPNTLITLTITTYSGPSLTGSVSFISTMVFDCTTGAVVRAPATAPGPPVPALSPGAIAALIALLALVGATRLRRPARRRV